MNICEILEFEQIKKTDVIVCTRKEWEIEQKFIVIIRFQGPVVFVSYYKGDVFLQVVPLEEVPYSDLGIVMIDLQQKKDLFSRYFHYCYLDKTEKIILEKSNTKYSTNMKYLTVFHGKDSDGCYILFRLSLNRITNGLSKDMYFTLDDLGWVGARATLDDTINRYKLKLSLYFTKDELDFIDIYGPADWIALKRFTTHIDYGKIIREISSTKPLEKNRNHLRMFNG